MCKEVKQNTIAEMYSKLNTQDKVLFIDHLLSLETIQDVFAAYPEKRQELLSMRAELCAKEVRS